MSFDLKKFLTENKLTKYSRLMENTQHTYFYLDADSIPELVDDFETLTVDGRLELSFDNIVKMVNDYQQSNSRVPREFLVNWIKTNI